MNTVIAIREAPANPLVPLTSIPDLWDIHVRMRGKLEPATIVTYDTIKRLLMPFFEKYPIGPELIQEWMKYIQGRQGATKVNWTNVRVRGFLRWLHTNHYVTRDYSLIVPTLTVSDPPKPDVITGEEYQTLKNFCTGNLKRQIYLWLIILSYRTGMTLVDCCHLRWSEVMLNFDGPSFIQKVRRKTKRFGARAQFTVPIVPGTDVFEWLMKLKSKAHLNYKRADGVNDYVHQDCPGMWEGAGYNLTIMLKHLFRRAGIRPGKSFRHLRNSFISNLVNSGVQQSLIMKMVGHMDPNTIMRYLRADVSALQAGMNQALDYAARQIETSIAAKAAEQLTESMITTTVNETHA
jgi:integrase